MKVFVVDGTSYLVISTFADTTTGTLSDRSYLFVVGEQINASHGLFGPSIRAFSEFNQTYRIGNSNHNPNSSVNFSDHGAGTAIGSPVIATVASFATFAAYAVEHAVIDGIRILAFASYSSSPSTVFACDSSMNPPVFEHMQDLETSFASSILQVQSNGSYLIVGQAGDESPMFRWNGSTFQLSFTQDTLPKDVASGDRIPSPLGISHAIAYFQTAHDSALTRCIDSRNSWNGSTF